jgi:hypothetical protein
MVNPRKRLRRLGLLKSRFERNEFAAATPRVVRGPKFARISSAGGVEPDLIILDDAEDELIAAEEWYEARKPGLSSELRLEIDHAIADISSTPKAGSAVVGVNQEIGARQVFVRRFPYNVVFLVDPATIWVLAFAHHRRQPGYWKGRLQGL